MTPGVKEAAQGTCHLPFLLSQGSQSITGSTVPSLGRPESVAPGRAHQYQPELPHSPPSLCHSCQQGPDCDPLGTATGQAQEALASGNFPSLPFSSNKNAQELCPGSQAWGDMQTP